MVQTRASAARPKFYVGLRRSPRAGTPAPYWTPIVATSPGANADGLSCDVFEMKAYRFNDNGEPIGYPQESVGDCVDYWPEEQGANAGAQIQGGKRARRTNRRRTNRRRSRKAQRR